jgi:hypothetical protein
MVFFSNAVWAEEISEEERQASLKAYKEQMALEAKYRKRHGRTKTHVKSKSGSGPAPVVPKVAEAPKPTVAPQSGKPALPAAAKSPPLKPELPSAPDETQPWSVYVGLGLSAIGSTQYSVTSDQPTGLYNDSMSKGIAANLGISYLLFRYFRLGLDFGYNGYGYSVGGAGGADLELTGFLVPRGQYKIKKTTLWAGVGAGMALVTVGGAGIPLPLGAVLPSAGIGLAFSPRIGADYDLNSDFFAGAQLADTFTGAALSGNTATSTTLITENYSRSWIDFTLRIGMRF